MYKSAEYYDYKIKKYNKKIDQLLRNANKKKNMVGGDVKENDQYELKLSHITHAVVLVSDVNTEHTYHINMSMRDPNNKSNQRFINTIQELLGALEEQVTEITKLDENKIVKDIEKKICHSGIEVKTENKKGDAKYYNANICLSMRYNNGIFTSLLYICDPHFIGVINLCTDGAEGDSPNCMLECLIKGKVSGPVGVMGAMVYSMDDNNIVSSKSKYVRKMMSEIIMGAKGTAGNVDGLLIEIDKTLARK